MYLNGVIVGSIATGTAQNFNMRTFHYVARSWWDGDGYLQGSIGYIRIYNDIALDEDAAASLFADRFNCRAGFYGNDGSCTPCASGMFSSGSSSCSVCPLGTYSAPASSECSISCASATYQTSIAITATDVDEVQVLRTSVDAVQEVQVLTVSATRLNEIQHLTITLTGDTSTDVKVQELLDTVRGSIELTVDLRACQWYASLP